MNFKTEDHANNTVIEIMVERLDAAIAPELKTLVVELVEQNKRRVLLDFDKVVFMDSSGLGAVVSGLKAVGEDGEFIVCNLHGVVEELFKLTHMDRVFEITGSRDDGLQQLAA